MLNLLTQASFQPVMSQDLEQNGKKAGQSIIITYYKGIQAENFAGGLYFSHISPIELGFGLASLDIIPLTMINSYQNSLPYAYFFENSQLSRTPYIIRLIDKDYFSPSPNPIYSFRSVLR